MLDAGLLEERDADGESPRRRTYRLTRAGRRLLEREAERLARAAEWAAAKRLLPQAQGVAMINRWLRHLVFSVAGRLPPSRRAYLGDDLTATIGALADDARATGGAAGERAYLCRELVEVLRNAWVAGHERDVARDGPARRLLDACRDDVRASLRQWRRRPAAAAGVVGTLGMAVAAVVTTFGLLTAVLWRPLPFPHDERLVFVWESASDERGPFRATSARFSDWERGIGAFERVAAFGAAGFSLDSRDGFVPVRGDESPLPTSRRLACAHCSDAFSTSGTKRPARYAWFSCPGRCGKGDSAAHRKSSGGTCGLAASRTR